MVLGRGGVTQLCCQPQQPFDILSIGGGAGEVVGVIIMCSATQHLQCQHSWEKRVGTHHGYIVFNLYPNLVPDPTVKLRTMGGGCH